MLRHQLWKGTRPKNRWFRLIDLLIYWSIDRFGGLRTQNNIRFIPSVPCHMQFSLMIYLCLLYCSLYCLPFLRVTRFIEYQILHLTAMRIPFGHRILYAYCTHTVRILRTCRLRFSGQLYYRISFIFTKSCSSRRALVGLLLLSGAL